jgi:membrane-associated phospholipid phosphatase
MSRLSMEEPKASFDPATNPADPGVALAAGAVWLMVDLSVSPPSNPRWTGGILFDDPLRSGVTLESRSARDDAALASDLTLAATFVPWLFLDVAPAAWREEGRTDAWNAFLHMAGAVAVNDTATTAVKSIAGRQRPFGRKCRSNPDYHSDCGGSDENASFFSGHASNAFTAAGMICSGRRSATDRVLCGTALATASATAVLRVLADDHYATDVIVGGSVGWVVGYFWRRLSGPGARDRQHWVSPQVVPGVLGLAYERRW